MPAVASDRWMDAVARTRGPPNGHTGGMGEEGGDPVCWLDRVCENCGRFMTDQISPVCQFCGAPRDGDWPATGTGNEPGINKASAAAGGDGTISRPEALGGQTATAGDIAAAERSAPPRGVPG